MTIHNTEAYIERHKYISNKYPALEKTCRKQILQSILWVIHKAWSSNELESNMDSITELIDKLRKYDTADCGLDHEKIILLKLLYTDIKLYEETMNQWMK